MTDIDKTIAELEALEKASGEVTLVEDAVINTCASDHAKRPITNTVYHVMREDGAFVIHDISGMAKDQISFIAAAPTMMQVIRELQAQLNEKDRLLGAAVKKEDSIAIKFAVVGSVFWGAVMAVEIFERGRVSR